MENTFTEENHVSWLPGFASPKRKRNWLSANALFSSGRRSAYWSGTFKWANKTQSKKAKQKQHNKPKQTKTVVPKQFFL